MAVDCPIGGTVNINDIVTAINTNENNISDNTSAINTKENSLGNPQNDGQVLSSLTDGTRSWIDAQFDETFGNYYITDSDLDSITTAGQYYCITCTNKPSDSLDHGSLIVSPSNNAVTVHQTYQDKNNVWIRRLSNSVWDSWINLQVSRPENGVGNTIKNTIYLTQAEYDALTPVSDSMYIIVG